MKRPRGLGGGCACLHSRRLLSSGHCRTSDLPATETHCFWSRPTSGLVANGSHWVPSVPRRPAPRHDWHPRVFWLRGGLSCPQSLSRHQQPSVPGGFPLLTQLAPRRHSGLRDPLYSKGVWEEPGAPGPAGPLGISPPAAGDLGRWRSLMEEGQLSVSVEMLSCLDGRQPSACSRHPKSMTAPWRFVPSG